MRRVRIVSHVGRRRDRGSTGDVEVQAGTRRTVVGAGPPPAGGEERREAGRAVDRLLLRPAPAVCEAGAQADVTRGIATAVSAERKHRATRCMVPPARPNRRSVAKCEPKRPMSALSAHTSSLACAVRVSRAGKPCRKHSNAPNCRGSPRSRRHVVRTACLDTVLLGAVRYASATSTSPIRSRSGDEFSTRRPSNLVPPW